MLPFELSVACKYLLPKKRSFSTALISILSVFVVSLVVWLSLVFLSVTSGIEKNWLHKLTSLQGPIRISPTEKYYRSYYYQIDSLASASNFTLKTVGEKGAVLNSDPYSKETDMEVPFYWAKPEHLATGVLLDPVKLAIQELKSVRQEIKFDDFEIGGALLKLQLQREGKTSYLSQMSYLLSFCEKNDRFASLVVTPYSNLAPDEILLPKSYQDSGVLVGDFGFLSYAAPSAASSQEQRVKVRVAGFYDPGFLSLGNRCIIVPKAITRAIYSVIQTSSPDGTPTNGFYVWPKSLQEVEEVKKEIASRFEKAGIRSYWKIASYEEFESSKDLLHQFRSDKTLFTLISTIILIVACCNIVSLLILLVHDKKREIAILQSMGASHKQIASIFALCALVMGTIASFVGIFLAMLTLHYLQPIVSLLSAIQGRAALNPLFFGQTLPNQISSEALLFVLIATPLISLLAAFIPTFKAMRLRPAQALRSE